nr:hypothetical protein [Desulfobacterales bacterium]
MGASPIFADIELRTFNSNPEEVRRLVTPRTRAAVVPHIFGLSADMESLLELGISVIEDCAQAMGAVDNGHPGVVREEYLYSLFMPPR